MDGNKVRTSSLWNLEGSLLKKTSKKEDLLHNRLNCIQLIDKRLKLLNESSALSEPINVTFLLSFLVHCWLSKDFFFSSFHPVKHSSVACCLKSLRRKWFSADDSKFLFQIFFFLSLLWMMRGSNCAVFEVKIYFWSFKFF